MQLNKHYLAIFGLLYGAVCWGLLWYPYRIMQLAGVSGVASSFYTYAITCVLALLLFARQWRKEFSHWRPSMILLGLAAGWTNLSYVIAVIDGEVMRVMLLFYLSPLWTLLLAHFWLKEKVGLQGLLVISVSLLGAFIMLWQANTWPVPANTAEWFALSAGVGFAFSNVLTRQLNYLSVLSKSATIWLGVVVMAAVLLPWQSLPVPVPGFFSLTHWLVMGLIALLLMSATLLVQFGITHLPVTRASVIFLFELVVAAIASYYLANEQMQLHEWLGGGLIIAASLYAAHMQD